MRTLATDFETDHAKDKRQDKNKESKNKSVDNFSQLAVSYPNLNVDPGLGIGNLSSLQEQIQKIVSAEVEKMKPKSVQNNKKKESVEGAVASGVANSNATQYKAQAKCYNCQGFGHFARDCGAVSQGGYSHYQQPPPRANAPQRNFRPRTQGWSQRPFRPRGYNFNYGYGSYGNWREPPPAFPPQAPPGTYYPYPPYDSGNYWAQGQFAQPMAMQAAPPVSMQATSSDTQTDTQVSTPSTTTNNHLESCNVGKGKLDNATYKKLVGSVKSTKIKIQGVTIDGQLDDGSQVSTMIESCYKKYFSDVPLIKLYDELSIRNSSDGIVPYLGYIDVPVTCFDININSVGIFIQSDPTTSHLKSLRDRYPILIGANITDNVPQLNCTIKRERAKSKLEGSKVRYCNQQSVISKPNENAKLVDIFVSKKLQFNNEKYSQAEWNKLGWHDLFDVSNHIQGSFSSKNNNIIFIIKC